MTNEEIIRATTPLVLFLIGLVFWRLQLIAKRRFEVAEEVLVNFALAREAVAYTRNNFGHFGEGSTRERAPKEDPNVTRELDRYFTPIERLNKMAERFAPLAKTRFLCRYHFGPKAEEAMLAVFRARSDIVLSAQELMDEVGSKRPRTKEDDDYRRTREADIWRKPKGDPIEAKLDEAQAVLESFCRPAMRRLSILWPW